MRFLRLLLLVSSLLLAESYTVKEDNEPLRDGCSDNAAELARLKRGDAVKIRFALQRAQEPCYAVTVETAGKRLQGYVWGQVLTGLEAFDAARRKADPGPRQSPLKVQADRRGARAPDPERRYELPPPQNLASVPEFSFASLEGPGAWSRASLAGKTYLLYFWATWCGYCRAEMPSLHQVYSRYKYRNFEIVTVSIDDSQRDVAQFRQGQWKMPWAHAYAGPRRGSTQPFQVTGVPTAFLVDASGRIVAQGGGLRGGNLEPAVTRALGGE